MNSFNVLMKLTHYFRNSNGPVLIVPVKNSNYLHWIIEGKLCILYSTTDTVHTRYGNQILATAAQAKLNSLTGVQETWLIRTKVTEAALFPHTPCPFSSHTSSMQMGHHPSLVMAWVSSHLTHQWDVCRDHGTLLYCTMPRLDAFHSISPVGHPSPPHTPPSPTTPPPSPPALNTPNPSTLTVDL